MRNSCSWGFPAWLALWLATFVPIPGLCADEPEAVGLLPPETPIAEAIDHYIEAHLREMGVEPAPPADAETLLRRTTLDLAGRIPTTAELREYLSADATDRRERLIDRLLASEDFVYHQTNELDQLLFEGRDGGREWREWLLQAVRENRSWDRMFREMLVGPDKPGDSDAGLAFVRSRIRELDRLTDDTSRIFFGVSISCAKCHDHPLVPDWTQDHYYGLASFFGRTYLTKKNTLADKPFGHLKFKTTKGQEKQARFMFLTGKVVEEPAVEWTDEARKAAEEEVRRQMKDAKAPPPAEPAFRPRVELVRIALQPGENRFFARAIVNRLWARLFGYGLVEPRDQLHSENPPSHPELLDWLARDLVEHGYDLKRLMRGMVASRTYARDSRWTDGERPDPSLFAVASVRPLTPRQYSLSLWIATTAPEKLPGMQWPADWPDRRASLERASEGLAALLAVPRDNFQVGLDEALLFSNSERIERDFLSDSRDRLVGTLVGTSDTRAAIEAAFQATLSRLPTTEEAEAVEDYLASRSDRLAEAWKQVVWALLSGPEMRFNH